MTSSTEPTRDPFEAMGHPIPSRCREAAYRAVKEMVPDVANSEAWSLVERMADHLERDQPYKAMEEATTAGEYGHGGQPGLRIDLTGAYRLMAHLLAGAES